MSKTAKVLYLVALLVSAAWFWITFRYLPFDVIPLAPKGWAIAAFYYLGPGAVLGFVASTRVPIRTTRCGACGHVDESKRSSKPPKSRRRLVS